MTKVESKYVFVPGHLYKNVSTGSSLTLVVYKLVEDTMQGHEYFIRDSTLIEIGEIVVMYLDTLYNVRYHNYKSMVGDKKYTLHKFLWGEKIVYFLDYEADRFSERKMIKCQF
jgi:hypothetical protein